jgi:hypothetical protein
VVGGEHVAEQGEHAGAADLGGLRRSRLHVLEERRPPDEGAARRPGISLPRLAFQAAPLGRAFQHRGVTLTVERRGEHLVDDAADLVAVWPDIAQVDRPAVGAVAERLALQVHEHASRQRIRHHQRRRGEEIRAHRRVYSPLKIAITR